MGVLGPYRLRERLFKIIEDLVPRDNTNNEVVLARDEVCKSWLQNCGVFPFKSAEFD